VFLNDQRGKRDWSNVDIGDVEEFLGLLPKGRARRLTVLEQFFRFARAPTASSSSTPRNG
jgi:hypothetical protein